MEISRGYEPLFKTIVKGLAKVKLESREKLAVEEVHQLIASSALKSNDGFLDYKMLLYDDAIRFEENKDGSSFPEIPFASVLHLVALPNFPDVCFIQFRRSTYGMYVILRFKKVKYVSKVAKFICSWSNASVSDTEESVTALSESTLQSNGKKGNNQRPVIVHRLNHVVNGSRSKYSHSRRENTAKTLKTEGTQTAAKNPVTNKATCVGHSNLVHTKNAAPNTAKRATTFVAKRNHSQPVPDKSKKDPPRGRRFSEPSLREDGSTEGSKVNLHWQPGEYTVIVPTFRGWPSSKGGRKQRMEKSRAPTRPKGVERRVKNVISDSCTSTSSTSSTPDLIDMHGREVKTIYPSHMEPGRMSPRSRRNEHLLHMLSKPLS